MRQLADFLGLLIWFEVVWGYGYFGYLFLVGCVCVFVGLQAGAFLVLVDFALQG